MKLNGTNSSWLESILGFPQGSILGPLLFNILLCNLFQFFPDLDITNDANHNTLHLTNINLNKVLHEWFRKSRMKFLHYRMSISSHETFCFKKHYVSVFVCLFVLLGLFFCLFLFFVFLLPPFFFYLSV